MTQEELSALKMVLYLAHSESFKNEDYVMADGTDFIVNPTNLKLMNLEFFGGGVEKHFKVSED